MNFPRGGTDSLVKLEFSLLKQPLAGHMHEPPAETEFLQFFSFFSLFFFFFFSHRKAKQGRDIQQGDYQSSRTGSELPQSTPTEETNHHAAEHDTRLIYGSADPPARWRQAVTVSYGTERTPPGTKKDQNVAVFSASADARKFPPHPPTHRPEEPLLVFFSPYL